MFLKSCFARVHVVSVVERAESPRLKAKLKERSDLRCSVGQFCVHYPTPSISVSPFESHGND